MNLKLVFSALMLLGFCASTYATGLRGKIFDEEGNPLPYAAIYVKETGSGTTANEEGRYELKLEPGDYTIVFQYLGFQPQVKAITIEQQFRYLEVTLEKEALQLQEVDVVGSKEDPAYTVMRKAIAKASYHRQQLDAYQVEVYIKGSGRLIDSPRMLEGMIEQEGIDSSVAFTTESVSILNYERPNTYKERVLSVYTSGDDNDTAPNSYIQGSFYEPKIAEAISPLSPRAFGYYRFKHEGYFIDRGYGVNKIRVIPRTRGEGVYEGLIYIVEDLWSIHSLSLNTYKLGFRINIDQVYAPVQEAVWTPVNQTFQVEGKIFGFTFAYQYLIALSDYEITLNPELDADFVVVDEAITSSPDEPPASLENQTVNEQLSSGEELTRKELRKLMKAYEKQERKEAKAPEVVENTSLSIDSLAYQKDSSYWRATRPVPLTQAELKGYQRADSIAQAEAEAADSLARIGVNREGGFRALSIIGGGTYKLGHKQSFSHSSIWDRFFFNPVEGFSLHTDLSYSSQKKNPFKLTLTPRYAFSRKKLTGKGALSYSYGKAERQHQTQVEGGRYIFQYNSENPISFLFNSVTSLAQKRNYLRLYEKDYLRLSHLHRFRENIVLNASVEWAERFHLSNTTDWSLLTTTERVYESNTFINREYNYPVPVSEKAFVLDVSLELRPWQKYRIVNGTQKPIEHSTPLFRLNYRQGLPDINESITDYTFASVEYEQTIEVGVRGLMDVRLEAGRFFSDESLGFADFHHFMGNRILLISGKPVGHYRLLPYYEFSTRDQYASGFVHYQFRKFALTRIPEIWLMGIKENVFVNHMTTPIADHYTEVGYSIDNILRLFRIETAVSFQNGAYRDWGIFLGISSNLGGGVFTVQ
jgi:hypothetical protein